MRNKKLVVAVCVVCALALVGLCVFLVTRQSGNEYGLQFTLGDGEKLDYIYYNENFVVYIVGGMMMSEVDGTPKMLELALHDGDFTVEEIFASAEADVGDEEIARTDYPDGSVMYSYPSFNLVRLNTFSGNRDVYFVPKSMDYYSVCNN